MSDPSAPATKADLELLATKEDLKAFATKEDLKAFATKEDLNDFVTKDDLQEQLKLLATKDELQEQLKAMEGRIVLTLAGEIARSANVMVEHMTAQYRVADDRTSAVGDRVAGLEQRVDEHVADASVHRAPRRRAR